MFISLYPKQVKRQLSMEQELSMGDDGLPLVQGVQTV